MSQLTVTRSRPVGSLNTTSGQATLNMINTYLPPYEIAPATGVPCHVALAFTPTGTSITVNPTADDAITVTGGTAREYISLSGAIIASAHHFRAGARRKPGSTGAIVAQLVTFTINSIELGRFTVLAAAAGEDPVSGSFEMVSPTPDARYALFSGGASRDMTIAVTAVDSDLEIFFEMSGDD